MNKKNTYCYPHPRPALSVDLVLFRDGSDEREVLLIQRKGEPFAGMWAFPGGFVDQDEALDAAAARELNEETGIEEVRLEQFGAFGDPGRDPRGHTVSIGFTALVAHETVARAGDDAAEVRWMPVGEVRRLAFDHDKILRRALAYHEARRGA